MNKAQQAKIKKTLGSLHKAIDAVGPTHGAEIRKHLKHLGQHIDGLCKDGGLDSWIDPGGDSWIDGGWIHGHKAGPKPKPKAKKGK
ncbi:MAG: hypothetical protein JST92_09445 [Deltaproteobacteria bacterium]|nr:hypothetical protein [Deltaproteobacteria bacterium]